MYLVYYDESGDDGFPNYSSELFVLSGYTTHDQDWKDDYQTLKNLRTELKNRFNFPVKWELKIKDVLLNKNPYRTLGLKDSQRLELCKLIALRLATLKGKFVNVVINKTKILRPEYDVLKNAVTYNVQRIENTLSAIDLTNKFLIITDDGRVGKMRKTIRKIQRFNYIPSKFGTSPYRKEIKLLIEDPLPKQSHESFFIQISDYLAYLVYLYSMKNFTTLGWPTRISSVITEADVNDILVTITPILNLKATSSNSFGIVCYPK